MRAGKAGLARFARQRQLPAALSEPFFANMQQHVSALAIVVLSFFGCKPDSDSPGVCTVTERTNDVAAVNQLSKDYAAAWAKGDPDLLLDCYADDAVVIMSN